jgi:type IV pilus assembly protein PilQ
VLQAAAIQDISFAALPGDKVQITVKADGALPQPASFNTDNPPRLAIDFNQVGSQVSKQPMPVGLGLVRSVQTLAAGDRTRVVVNLSAAAPYEVVNKGNESIITVLGTTKENLASNAKVNSSVTGVTSKRNADDRYAVQEIDFRRGEFGEGKVLIKLADPGLVIDTKQEGSSVVVSLVNAQIPPKLLRKLDVIDFGTPVQTVNIAKDGSSVKITIQGSGLYEYMSYQLDQNYVVELKPLTIEEEIRLRETTYSGERLSLNFQDIEVRSVLQLLAEFTGKNLVVSDSVNGNITLRLANVPWDQALDIILKSKRLGKRETNNVLSVAPLEELIQADRAQEEALAQQQKVEPIYAEWFQLNFVAVEEVASILSTKEETFMAKNALSETTFKGSERIGQKYSIISPIGTVSYDKRSNTLLVKDTQDVLDEVRRLLKRIDIPLKQVLIESRIVTANDDFTKDLGVRLGLAGTGVNGSVTSPDSTYYSVGGGLGGGLNNGLLPGAAGLDAGNYESIVRDPLTGAPSVQTQAYGLLPDSLLVNLPAAAPTSAINFVLGKAFSHIISLELSAMQSEGKGEVISTPRVMTADGKEATIEQGFEIPYQESAESGATTTAFKKATMELKVTPRITPNDTVVMALKVKQDEPDFGRAVNGVPSLQTRSVDIKEIQVDNGETLILGGVFTAVKSIAKKQTPLLGDLPYVGNLFKSKLTKEESRELLIFVSPKIIKEGIDSVVVRPSAK